MTTHRVYVTARRYAVALLALAGALWLIIVYTPVPVLLARPLWRTFPPPSPAEVIVVLSGGRYPDGSLNQASFERTVAAVRLYHQRLAPQLLFSGGPCCGQSASALMAHLAVELGVPRDAILLDEQATRTRGSAVNTAALFRRTGRRSAILVTSPLHMLRAQLAFSVAGVPVYPVPASSRNLLRDSSGGDRMSLVLDAVHEYLGLAFYRARGWA